MSKTYDLTSRLAPYLDIHMLGPLLDFLREGGLYDKQKIALEKTRVFVHTNMVDTVRDELAVAGLQEQLKAEPELAGRVQALLSREEAILAQLDHPPAEAAAAAALFAQPEVAAGLRDGASAEQLERLGVTPAVLAAHLAFGRHLFSCGCYAEAEAVLGHCLAARQPGASAPLGTLWGRLACRILLGKWADALSDFTALKEGIETRGLAPVEQLRQRAWLMHWALFVLVNQPAGMEMLRAFMCEKAYLQTMENACPHLLRYYAAAAVLSGGGRRAVREALAEVQTLARQYSDPVTALLESLYDRFDLPGAAALLTECGLVLAQDFFLQLHAEAFLRRGRAMVCELCCQLSRRVDLPQLAALLSMSEEDTEKWMIDIAGSGARIDSAARQLVAAEPSADAARGVMQRTKDAGVRSGILYSNLEALLREQGAYIQHCHQQH